jgi:hypothetical protein
MTLHKSRGGREPIKGLSLSLAAVENHECSETAVPFVEFVFSPALFCSCDES